jgi:hypothetical protein
VRGRPWDRPLSDVLGSACGAAPGGHGRWLADWSARRSSRWRSLQVEAMQPMLDPPESGQPAPATVHAPEPEELVVVSASCPFVCVD